MHISKSMLDQIIVYEVGDSIFHGLRNDLKVAFDWHGTLDTYEEMRTLFLMHAARCFKSDTQKCLYIISGDWPLSIASKMNKLFKNNEIKIFDINDFKIGESYSNIDKYYDNKFDVELTFNNERIKFNLKVLSLLGYICQNKLPMEIKTDNNGKQNIYTHDEIWNALKAIICKENDISVIFDNEKNYQYYFGKDNASFKLITKEYVDKIKIVLDDLKSVIIKNPTL